MGSVGEEKGGRFRIPGLKKRLWKSKSGYSRPADLTQARDASNRGGKQAADSLVEKLGG